jgi:hypothetical protein
MRLGVSPRCAVQEMRRALNGPYASAHAERMRFERRTEGRRFHAPRREAAVGRIRASPNFNSRSARAHFFSRGRREAPQRAARWMNAG